jgi:hypothetical protein
VHRYTGTFLKSVEGWPPALGRFKKMTKGAKELKKCVDEWPPAPA